MGTNRRKHTRSLMAEQLERRELLAANLFCPVEALPDAPQERSGDLYNLSRQTPLLLALRHRSISVNEPTKIARSASVVRNAPVTVMWKMSL